MSENRGKNDKYTYSCTIRSVVDEVSEIYQCRRGLNPNVYEAGVRGGPIVSRVTVEVVVVGSNITRDSFYKSTVRKHDSVSWQNSMLVDEHNKLKSGNAEPYAQ